MSGQTEAITFTYDREYEPAILAAAGRMFGRPGEGRIVGEPRSASRES